MSRILLTCRNLSVSAGDTTILDNVNLEIPKGEVHVLMGPNGAGKSTLGHAIMGDPTYDIVSGSIVFDGADITDMPPHKRSQAGLFLSFQAPVEIPGVPLRSFLRTALESHGSKMKNKEFKKRIAQLSESLDMDPSYLDRELGVGFSGGEKKKVEMAQLLLLEPKLAILDETDSGLDVDALSVVSRGMELYRTTCDGTLLVITHNTRILERLSVDKVHVMIAGRTVSEGPASLIDEIDAQGFERYERGE